MAMSINVIIENKIKYEMGQLYNYLNQIEDTLIMPQLTGESLANFYNLNANFQYRHWRCVCPFHSGASNNSAFIFNDDKNSFYCFSCKISGTYIKFIALMQGYTSNAINEAKIFAALHFANLDLGFNSISDYKGKVRQKVMKLYGITRSLNMKDYYDISILPSPSILPKSLAPIKQAKPLKCGIKGDKPHINPPSETDAEYDIYDQAIEAARDSILIREILQGKKQFNSADKLQNFMKSKYFISGDILEEYGLVYFDKRSQHKLTKPNFYGLNDRVIFPIRDHQTGIVAGFHCRLTHNNKDKSKKWWKYSNGLDYGELKTKDNGYQYYGIKPFSIGQFLFNLYEIKGNKVEKIWITEGIADCLKLISLGFNHAVSPGQANLTDEQINLLKRYFGCETEILLFFDTDNNNIGQCNSIQIAYKLWNSGFKRIKIVRTFQGQGKDLTDVAVEIQDDSQLRILIDLWEKSAYTFSPSPVEDLNTLLDSGLYTDSQVYSIDPRNIEDEIAKVKLLERLGKLSDLDIKELKSINNIAPIVEHNINNTRDNTNSKILNPANADPHPSFSRSEIELCRTGSSQNPEYYLMNISDAQLYWLKQMFDMDTIEEIDVKATREDIIDIVGKIINSIPFNLDEYLYPEKYTPSTLVDENLNPILIEPEDMPF